MNQSSPATAGASAVSPCGASVLPDGH